MSTSAGVTKTLSGLALALGLAAVGCGPSPAYFEEPRTPAGMEMPPGVSTAEPTPSSELAQQPQVVQAQQQAEAQQVQPAPGDVNIGASADEYADTDPAALTDWRPVLENHGTWVDDATYGTIWVPSQTEVGSDFQPYVSAGHWTYSDSESWVWVSDYDWGWVPFHYGRWVYLSGPGWAWIPGRTYAGAWVVWRTGPYGYDYVGWAPAPPEWYWWHGYAVGWSFGWHHPHYVYCHNDYIYRPHVHSHVVYGGTPAAGPIEARTNPYRPATPGVAGGGRVVANPGVGGSGRVVATPAVGGGRVIAGPKPSELGVKPTNVVTPPSNDTRLARAQAFATPATARPLGAQPPVQTRTPPRRYEPDAVVGTGPTRGGFGANGSPSVSSRLDPVARAPQVQGVAPRPTPSRSLTDSSSFSTRGAQPSPGVSTGSSPNVPHTPPLVDHWQRPSPSPTPSTPTYRSSPSVHAQPSSPTFRPSTPSFSQSSPSVHSSSPSVRSSPSFSQSAPSVRPSTPSHSSPSRATPSVRAGSRGGRR